jgi:hypothetical protein
MPELVSRTARVRRGLVDRLKGFNRLYETRVSDGYRDAIGRGSTPQASQSAAHRMWETSFGRGTEVTDYELPLPAPSIALNAGNSTSLAALREVIDALRADSGRLLRLLIKRFANDGQPEHKELVEILVNHPNFRYLVATGVEEQRVA